MRVYVLVLLQQFRLVGQTPVATDSLDDAITAILVALNLEL